MQYHGGKEKIAGQVVDVLLAIGKAARCDLYLEPFVGGASILSRMAPHFPGRAIGADLDCDLAMLWSHVATGWEPPSVITREDYARLRAETGPSPERAFAKYGCSFGGKAWGGYASNARGDDFAGAARRGILKKAVGLRDVTVACADYRAFAPNAGTLVYCDPPYAGTTSYAGTGSWDPAEFWRTMSGWADDRGATVLVSEYEAPPGWEVVWERERRTSMAKGDNLKVAVERLFAPA